MQSQIIGLKWPFKISNIGKIQDGNISQLIEASIHRILGTRIGELVGEPQFGSKLMYLIFEPNDEVLQNLGKLYIIEALSLWEPRITVLEVEGERASKNVFVFTIYYKETYSNENKITTFPINLAMQ